MAYVGRRARGYTSVAGSTAAREISLRQWPQRSTSSRGFFVQPVLEKLIANFPQVLAAVPQDATAMSGPDVPVSKFVMLLRLATKHKDIVKGAAVVPELTYRASMKLVRHWEHHDPTPLIAWFPSVHLPRAAAEEIHTFFASVLLHHVPYIDGHSVAVAAKVFTTCGHRGNAIDDVCRLMRI